MDLDIKVVIESISWVRCAFGNVFKQMNGPVEQLMSPPLNSKFTSYDIMNRLLTRL